MNSENLDATADYLCDLRLKQKTVDALPQALAPASLEDAYRAQQLLVEKLCSAWGGEPCGYKIALTNSAAQQMLGVPHPVFGRILSARLYESGITIRSSDFVVCVIECEVGLRLKADIPARTEDYSRAEISQRVDYAVPAMELVEYHFSSIDKVTPVSLAADNAIHGGWVHGPAMSLGTDESLDAVLADQPTRLEVNGDVVLQGSTAKVLGHPLDALCWLANHLPRYGKSLQAGEFVTTGITTDEIYLAQPGDQLRASLGKIGEVSLTYA